MLYSKYFAKVVILLVFLGISFASTAQNRYKKLDYYVYVFTKNVTWPKEVLTDSFKVAVFGDTDANARLKILADKQQIKGLPTELLVFNSLEEIRSCHVVFIPRKYDDKIEQIIRSLAPYTLIITELPGHAFKGSNININWNDEVSGDMHFEVNRAAFEKGGLEMTDLLAHNKIR